MVSKSSECAMCKAVKDSKLVFYDGKLCAAFVLTYPVTEFHCLCLPKRHVVELSELSGAELSEMFAVMGKMEKFIEKRYPGAAIIAMNRGANSTQPHLHFHVINSKGGLRKLLMAKLGCEMYPPASREKLEKLAEEYKAFAGNHY